MVCNHVLCALQGLTLTYESQGRLRCYTLYKGLYPLRRFAAIPVPSPEVKRRTEVTPSLEHTRFSGFSKILFYDRPANCQPSFLFDLEVIYFCDFGNHKSKVG